MLVANVTWVKFQNLLFFVVMEHKTNSGERAEDSLTMWKLPTEQNFLQRSFNMIHLDEDYNLNFNVSFLKRARTETVFPQQAPI